MIIEIKFIIITLLICVSQFFQLAILGIFFKNIDPKINFLITSILCYLLINLIIHIFELDFYKTKSNTILDPQNKDERVDLRVFG